MHAAYGWPMAGLCASSSTTVPELRTSFDLPRFLGLPENPDPRHWPSNPDVALAARHPNRTPESSQVRVIVGQTDSVPTRRVVQFELWPIPDWLGQATVWPIGHRILTVSFPPPAVAAPQASPGAGAVPGTSVTGHRSSIGHYCQRVPFPGPHSMDFRCQSPCPTNANLHAQIR